MRKMHTLSWFLFTLFVALAVFFNRESSFTSDGPHAWGKYLAWVVFLSFMVYTYYCSSRENLFRTIKTMNTLHWGRQIGLDLYIGLMLFMILIYLHSGSALVTLLWLVPVLAFANLATLLYLALHYDSLLAMLLP